MKKKLIILFLLIFLSCSFWAIAEEGQFTELPAKLKNRTKETPIKILVDHKGQWLNLIAWAQALEVAVEWQGLIKRLTLISPLNNKRLILVVGYDVALLDGKVRRLTHPPQLYHGQIYIPLAFAQEVLPELITFKITLMATPTPGNLSKASPKTMDQDIPQPKFTSEEKTTSSSILTEIPGVVVIDPGPIKASNPHLANLQEDIVTGFAVRLKQHLHSTLGAEVLVLGTGASDHPISNEERTAQANKAQAVIFLALRVGEHFSEEISGYAVHYLSELSDDLPLYEKTEPNKLTNPQAQAVWKWDYAYLQNLSRSEDLAKLIYKSLLTSVPPARELYQSRLSVLRGLTMPGVLIELGNLSNQDDRRRLQNITWREKFVEAVTGGMINYFRKQQGKGQLPQPYK